MRARHLTTLKHKPALNDERHIAVSDTLPLHRRPLNARQNQRHSTQQNGENNFDPHSFLSLTEFMESCTLKRRMANLRYPAKIFFLARQ